MQLHRHQISAACGVNALPPQGRTHTARSPIDGAAIADVAIGDADDANAAAVAAVAAFARLKAMPMPQRGQIVRELGEAFRAKKTELGRVLTLEVGKIRSEAEGEIQEIVDVCDFACGLSRSIGGSTWASERPEHRLNERWHPLGPVLCITAFNFPAAVWGWNAALALVCGNPIVWKPSLKAALTAKAVMQVASEVLARHDVKDAAQLLIVDDDVAAAAVADKRYALVSATGSTRMGKAVQQTVAARLGRSLLELGGNNALVVMADADLELALRAVVFGAFGTAGQRCTSTRRVLVQRAIADDFAARVAAVAERLVVGDPFHEDTLVGPLIDAAAVDAFEAALAEAKAQGATVLCGGRLEGNYVRPAVLRSRRDMPLCRKETFGPLVHIIEVDDVDDAIAVNNDSDHGLSAAIFTRDLRSAERFVDGADCGLCNVNTGTSGAEIGGAFGGEKDSGGGRESGGDSWKQYMRRQTSAVNYGASLPLAQGVRFDVDGAA